MSLAVFFKGILLIIAGLSHNYGLTPKDIKTVYHGQFFETMVLIWAVATRIVAMTLSTFHVIVMVALDFPQHISPAIFETLCPYPSTSIDTLRDLTTTFVLGVFVMVLASLLRGWCFHTLGRLFTYRVAVTSNHILVTSGPYAYVRHPSYTGVFMMLASAAFTYLLSHGNYIGERGIGFTPWKWLIYYWVICVAYSVISLRKRGASRRRVDESDVRRRVAEIQGKGPV
ncbi:Protein-S-isoprenylcysteine O-methyltransferase [Mycena sanguinolenta]|uniref:Protein-S-isoprenylcysteine O-methyltransferase n=1 Tax=Mycena sanguinolenta TaxID=230812 RepID=A0A8H7DLB9_9AGAR|nr:Protein-S-isoprenylcysteine O-methyltransferase [Mycena sanguinolenta]